jgi:hypothetical protein
LLVLWLYASVWNDFVFKTLLTTLVRFRVSYHCISFFFKLTFVIRKGAPHILRSFFYTHFHCSCRPTGDCGGSRDRTRNCCVAEDLHPLSHQSKFSLPFRTCTCTDNYVQKSNRYLFLLFFSLKSSFLFSVSYFKKNKHCLSLCVVSINTGTAISYNLYSFVVL